MIARWIAGCSAAVLLSTSGFAADDAKVARVCTVMTDQAAKSKAAGHQPDIVQVQLVLALTNEFGDDIQWLGTFVPESDALTEAACPQARTDILALTGAASLADVLR